MKPTLIMSIDPGLSGAVAVYNPSSKSLISVKDMPVHTDKKGRRRIDAYELSLYVGAYAPDIRFAVIEKVGPMPHDGVVQAFHFGYGTGIAAGVLSAHMLQIVEAEPAAWKSAMGLSRDKNLSRTRAMTLFPKEATLFKRAKDDGRAEAILMAVFAARYI